MREEYAHQDAAEEARRNSNEPLTKQQVVQITQDLMKRSIAVIDGEIAVTGTYDGNGQLRPVRAEEMFDENGRVAPRGLLARFGNAAARGHAGNDDNGNDDNEDVLSGANWELTNIMTTECGGTN